MHPAGPAVADRRRPLGLSVHERRRSTRARGDHRRRTARLARVYHVATIDYLLLGGDGQTWFGKGTNVIYGDIEVDAVAAYMTAHSPLDPRVEGRITQR